MVAIHPIHLVLQFNAWSASFLATDCKLSYLVAREEIFAFVEHMILAPILVVGIGLLWHAGWWRVWRGSERHSGGAQSQQRPKLGETMTMMHSTLWQRMRRAIEELGRGLMRRGDWLEELEEFQSSMQCRLNVPIIGHGHIHREKYVKFPVAKNLGIFL